MKFGKYSFEPSNLDKELFPGEGITKGDLIDYFVEVSEAFIRHAKDRPLAMHRFPDGIDGEDFFQKEIPDYFPAWVESVSVSRKEDKNIDMVMANNKATLAYLGQQACIAPHLFLSRKADLDHPDKMIFDLDPPEGEFKLVIEAARALREKLEEGGLKPYLMTTGSKGMHVVVPLSRKNTYDEVREKAKAISRQLADEQNEKFTTATRKDQRKGRLFLDYLRNSFGAHSIAPYAPRAIKGAPVACPIEWDEIEDLKDDSQTFKMKDIPDRLKEKGDPWKDFFRHGRKL